MARRSRSSLSDDQIFAALRALTERLGRLPVEGDLNMYKEFPLNASGTIRRFGSLARALLLAGVWFPQPHGVPHEPLDISRLIGRTVVYKHFDTPDATTLFLGGVATPEGPLHSRLSANIPNGRPVGGMAATSRRQGAPLYSIFINPVAGGLVDATASARGYEVAGMLMLPKGRPYLIDGEEVAVAMVIVYDLHEPHGFYFDGRFIVPREFSLNDYVEAATSAPVTA